MRVVEKLESEIAKLSTAEVAELTRWLNEFDARLWDHQMRNDAQPGGPLDRLAKEAIADYQAGRTTKLP